MEDRLTAVEEAILRHDAWHKEISVRMEALEKNTAEVLDLMNSWKGAMRVLGWLFKPITVLATIVGTLGTMWFTMYPKK